mgnify:CR=1 FL=1
MKTNSFYGFTDSIKQPRKAKVENTLSNLVRDNTNTVYRYADFIVNKINEGFNMPSIHTITHGMINTRYGREYGELATPKIEYRISNNENRCYTWNKTYFDFANYIIDNFKTLDDIQNFINTESDRIKAEQEAEEKRIADEKADKEAKEQAKKDFENWKCDEIKKLIDTDIHKLCAEVFTSIYPEYNYPLGNLSVVVYADNIENPLCRDSLISMLHNNNKASIKVFEVYTGVKLAKTHKERITQLETITKNDYKGMQEFKPRKKSEHTEKELETYYRRVGNEYIEAHGESIKIDGITFYIGKNDKGMYSVTESTTGILCSSDFKTSKTAAKILIKEIMQEKGEFIKNSISGAINKGIKSPLYSA